MDFSKFGLLSIISPADILYLFTLERTLYQGVLIVQAQTTKNPAHFDAIIILVEILQSMLEVLYVDFRKEDDSVFMPVVTALTQETAEGGQVSQQQEPVGSQTANWGLKDQVTRGEGGEGIFQVLQVVTKVLQGDHPTDMLGY